MPRYTLDVSERYDDDDDDSTTLHRIGGAAIGLSTGDWPRHGGRPMQHAFTIDLAELEIDAPRAAEARALAVFVDSYYELDAGRGEGITVVWLSQAQVDAYPQTPPPDDFVPEKLPGHETMDEEGEYYETGTPTLEPEEADEDEEGAFGDSYIGGAPAWADDEPPGEVPEGAFVLQVMSYEFPVCRRDASLYVFEGGACIQVEDPDDEEAPPPWSEAIARSREVVVSDDAPAADALQKWGGIPRGVSNYDWPKRMTHILTWVPEEMPEDSDAVAFALFGRLSKTDDWDTGEVSFYQVQEILQDELDEWNADEVEVPDGVEILDEKALELRPFPEGTRWRDLQERSFVGPRLAWRSPDHRSAEDAPYGPLMQLTDALLPVTPGAGTLHLAGSGHPIWHPTPGTPQSARERYEPKGTLYESDTTAAIVVGWRIELSDSVLPERIEALEQTLLSALDARQIEGLTLFVPGDTTTDRYADVYASLVFGRSVVVVEANDYEPGRIDPAAVSRALEALPPLDAGFWREALAFSEGMAASGGPGTFMLSWGPLCYAALYAGVAATREDTPIYTFVANQDMRQEWSSEGVDGQFIEGADFSSVCAVSLGPEALTKADKLEGAGFWLVCRYD